MSIPDCPNVVLGWKSFIVIIWRGLIGLNLQVIQLDLWFVQMLLTLSFSTTNIPGLFAVKIGESVMLWAHLSSKDWELHWIHGMCDSWTHKKTQNGSTVIAFRVGNSTLHHELFLNTKTFYKCNSGGLCHKTELRSLDDLIFGWPFCSFSLI